MKKNITGILLVILITAAVFAVKKFNSPENASVNLLSFDLNVTEMVDFSKLTSQGLPVIVDYGADTCIPCVNMAPVLEKLNKEMAGRVYIKFVDVWKYPDINKNIYAKVIPYQVFFDKKGKPYEPSKEVLSYVNFITKTENGKHTFTMHIGELKENQMRMIIEDMEK